MPEAANARPRLTISLKRSTQNLQLSTSRRPITPSFGGKADIDQPLLTISIYEYTASFRTCFGGYKPKMAPCVAL
jgi:hypothetical protein